MFYFIIFDQNQKAMISKKMESALNMQLELEGYASFLYLSMASWCDQQGMEGCATFMHRQSTEERGHMLRLFHYISEVGGHSVVPGIDKPPEQFESIQKLLTQVYEHEQNVTREINGLVDLCYKENDYNTLNFLQWYIKEQREEETLMRSIIDRVNLIGNGAMSLFYIDKELADINAAVEKQKSEGMQ